jgi:hypothetical protein
MPEGTSTSRPQLKIRRVSLDTGRENVVVISRHSSELLGGVRLLRCGCCGSGMSVHDRDKSGKTRIRCSAVRESGSCSKQDHLPARRRKTCAQRDGRGVEGPKADRDLRPQLQQ